MKKILVTPLFALVLACQGSGDSTPAGPPAVQEDAGRVPTTGLESDAGIDAALRSDEPIMGVRDRAGRPLIFRMLASEPNLDLYNTSPPELSIDPAEKAPGAAQEIGRDFQSSLVALDALDGADDWAGGPANAGPDGDGIYPHPLANALLRDVLVVDPRMPFATDGYLEIETNPDANVTCGGRWFSDDAVDKTVSFLISGSTSGFSDGVSAATKPPTLTFPYLAPPN